MIGNWKGYYKHESKRIPTERKKQKTVFHIEITEFENNIFQGKITEDVNTNGMNGTGKINGTIKRNKITFIKEMPIETQLMNGEVLETNKKHPKIYYKGSYNKLSEKYKGSWRFKFGFTKVNGKFAIIMPIKGIWEMEKR